MQGLKSQEPLREGETANTFPLLATCSFEWSQFISDPEKSIFQISLPRRELFKSFQGKGKCMLVPLPARVCSELTAGDSIGKDEGRRYWLWAADKLIPPHPALGSLPGTPVSASRCRQF